MPIITLTSDFGTADHYVAAIKAKILCNNPSQIIVDISHDIEHFNIAHGSFVLKSVYKDFPEGTVHLAAVNSHDNLNDGLIAINLDNHYFVAANNGLLSLISESEPKEIIQLTTEVKKIVFPEKEVLAPAAAKLATGSPLSELGTSITSMRKMIGRQVRATKKQISGHVVRVDIYGNLITNIEKKVFDILNKDNNYEVTFGRESFRYIHDNYQQADAGDCCLLFNSLGLLEISINHGNASELLGLRFDSPVNITFKGQL